MSKFKIGDRVLERIFRTEWEVIATAEDDYVKIKRQTKTLWGKKKEIIKWEREVALSLINN